MKKLLSILLFFVLCSGVAFSWQDNYRKSSDEVQSFYTLRTISGTATVEPTFPVSGTQLLNLVKQLDSTKLSGKALEAYNDLILSLENPSVVLKYKSEAINFDVPSLLGESTKTSDNFYYSLENMPSILGINATLYFSEYFCGKFDMDIDGNGGFCLRKDSLFTSLFNSLGLTKLSSFPNRAYGSIGFDKINLTIGRDRVSEGTGVSGNLGLSENFYFEDYAKFSFQGEKTAYDFTWIDFDTSTKERINFSTESKQVIQHRLSTSLFDMVSFSLYEGALVYTNNLLNDLRVLNPFMCFHNFGSYYSANTNNWCGVEVSVQTPFDFELNGQAFVDQILMPNERIESGPPAWGVLTNIKWAKAFEESIVKAYAEFAYTNEFCYQLAKDYGYGRKDADPDLVDYLNADLYVGISNVYSMENLAPIGYIYGTDVKTFAAGVSVEKWNQTFFANGIYVVDGPNGGYGNEYRSPIINEKATDSSKYPIKDTVGTQTSIRISVGAKGSVFRWLTYRAEAGFGIYENFEHIVGKDFTEPQFRISISIDPLKMFKKIGTTL